MLKFRHWHIIFADPLKSFIGSLSKIHYSIQVHISLDSDNERLRFANIGTTAEVLLLDFDSSILLLFWHYSQNN